MLTVRLLPWSTLLSNPVTVTVCPLFQLLVVKVKVAGLTVAAPVSLEMTVIVTVEVG